MSSALLIGIIVVVILGLLAFSFKKTLSRVETVRVGVDIPEIHDRTFFDGVVSIILYPLFFLSLIVCLFILVPLIVLFKPERILPVARIAGRFILLCSGIWLVVENKRNFQYPKPVLILMNHQSLYDAFILGAIMYRYFTGVGAAYQFKLPFWGFLLRKWGIIPIPRRDLTEAIKSIELSKEKFKQGSSVFMAPEGTRTLDGGLLPFKKGPFHFALQAEADILPVITRGVWKIKRKTDWRIKPGIVKVTIGDVIPYKTFSGMSVDELRDFIRGWYLTRVG